MLRQSGEVLRQGGEVLRQSGKGLRQGGEGLRQGDEGLRQDDEVLRQGGEVLKQGDEVLRQCGETRHQMMTLSSNQQRSVHKSHNFATCEYYSAEDGTDIGAQKNLPEGGEGVKPNILKTVHFLIVVAKHSACFPIFLLCILNWSVDVYISAQGASSPLTQPDPLSASPSQQITQRASPPLPPPHRHFRRRLCLDSQTASFLDVISGNKTSKFNFAN